ncbi:hypothetical protein BSKO_09556 [Bryopsis sp. KO-2023]|nr:hypothetical protein BSKO_09556 [Bryopsis sp. KO-2023]
MLVLVGIAVSVTAAFTALFYVRSNDHPAPTKIDLNASSVQKEISIKKKLQERHQSRGKTSSGNPDAKLPVGQFAAKSWVVLDLGIQIDLSKYDPWEQGDDFALRVCGVEGGQKDVTVGEIKRQLKVRPENMDWHCVTGWSTLGLRFKGVRMADFIELVKPQENWVCLWQVSADGYTTPIMREDLESDPDAFIALSDDEGKLLPIEHGGIRLVTPSLFGWKSAKYLTELHFLPYYRNGFWENLGCHKRGRVKFDERWDAKSEGVWKWLIWMGDQYRIWLGPRVYYFNMWAGAKVLGWFTRLFHLFTTEDEKRN